MLKRCRPLDTETFLMGSYAPCSAEYEYGGCR